MNRIITLTKVKDVELLRIREFASAYPDAYHYLKIGALAPIRFSMVQETIFWDLSPMKQSQPESAAVR
jgi:hypothetical protein